MKRYNYVIYRYHTSYGWGGKIPCKFKFYAKHLIRNNTFLKMDWAEIRKERRK